MTIGEQFFYILTQGYEDSGENDFVKEVYKNKMTDPLEILNWYRNLYYKEGVDTERGLMAMTINRLFMKYKDVFQ